MDKKKTSILSFLYRPVLFILPVFFLLSCNSKASYEDYGAPAFMQSEQAAPAPSMDRMASGAEAKASSSLMTKDQAASTDGSAASNQSTQENQRKRVYNGSAGLVVEDPPEIREKLENLANNSGGYVEQSYATYLILRVPADQFDTFFRQILGMGTVRYEQMDTWDVTDQYLDIQGRLSTAEETRKRLYVLLEKSTDTEERAKILREIGRLTEEIESIKQQLQILDSRIAFSRITVELIPRLQEDAYRKAIPFDWIASLSPLYPVSDSLKTSVKLDPGEDFALFSKEDIYIAEDAHGTSITISSVDNKPEGDEEFWQKALFHHLKDYYASAELRDLKFGQKRMLGVEFLSKDRAPFRYFVGLAAERRKIHVVEIFSQDGTKDFSPLYKAFEEGECR